MKLEFLALDKLHRCRSNMRFAKKLPDVSDILPSIRARGVLIPILVRAEPDESGEAGFGVIAGDRRFTAACALAEEVREAGGDPEPMPCAILEEGDDAAALEASMIENLQRLDPDEVTRWERFGDLVRQGRSIADIATTFALPELAVKRTLALGNLLPRVRTLYRADQIDSTSIRHLTLASKSQQRDWLKLFDDPEAHVPVGHRLKGWLFGGQAIPLRHAIFDTDAAKLATIADLFGDGGYFADSAAFWTAQNAAIEERRAAYVAAGWQEAVILPPTTHFASWEHEKMPKRKGGRVYIDVRPSGEVVFHEGYVTTKEARRAERPGADQDEAKPARPEVTATLGRYVDLHRHAAVRADLATHPQVALRLVVAHMVAGSPLWQVRTDPRSALHETVADSAEGAPAEAAFDGYRRAAQTHLAYPADEPNLVGGHGRRLDVPVLFGRLLGLPDDAVMAIMAVAMGETLASGSPVIEALGPVLGTDMASWWQADDAFFDLLRDREVLLSMVTEVAGETVATANAGEKAKTLKAIIRTHLDGEDGRAKVENWVPRWMRFAPSAYTARGGVPTVRAALAAAERRDAVDGGAVFDPEAEAEDASFDGPEEGGALAA